MHEQRRAADVVFGIASFSGFMFFGYEALQFIDAETTGRLYMYWNIIIGNLLQDIMTYQKMQKLVVKLEEMYDRDALTGMYNRRGFENRGNPMFEQAKEEGKQIFLAIIDMDGMKQINDNYKLHRRRLCVEKSARSDSSCMSGCGDSGTHRW